jgi:hypothetical protein
MQRYLLLILLFFCFHEKSLAQTDPLYIYNIFDVCFGSKQQIFISNHNAITPNTKFKVLVSKNNNSSEAIEVAAVLTGSNTLEVLHQNPKYANWYNATLKVVATNPDLESSWASFRIFSNDGKIHLYSAGQDTINNGDDLKVNFLTHSNSSFELTLSDSTKRNYYPQDSIYTTTLRPVDDKPVFIVRASNVCGPMRTSGEVKPVINSIALRAVLLSDPAPCEDNEIRIGFSTLGNATIPESAKFRVAFTEETYTTKSGSTVFVDAKREKNELIVHFPKSFNLKKQTPFHFRIHVNNPNLVSAISSTPLQIYPTAQVTFGSISKEINFGESAHIELNAIGRPPYEVTFNTGEVVNFQYSSASFKLNPSQNTTYTIQRFKSGCGVQENLKQQNLAISVKKGIKIVEPQANVVVCMGSEMRVPILTNFENQNASNYFIIFYLQNGGKESHLAQRMGDELVLRLPSVDSWERSHQNNGINGISVSITNPEYSSSVSYRYQVLSMPEVMNMPAQTLTYEYPEYVGLYYRINGNGPFTIEDGTGEMHRVEGQYFYKSMYVNQNTSYSIRSISNACFKRNMDFTTDIVIQKPNGAPKIYMEPLETTCNTDSLTVGFVANGQYDEENKFSIQFYNYNTGTYESLKSVKQDGFNKVLIPNVLRLYSNASIRIASSHPVTFSNAENLSIHHKIENVTIVSPGTADEPTRYYEGYNPNIYLSASNTAITSFIYTDGENQQTNMGYATSKLPLAIGVTTTFTILSATNACGTIPLSLKTTVRLEPYQMRLENTNSSSFCTGQEMQLYGSIYAGKPQITTTYTLQYKYENDTQFVDLLTNHPNVYFNFKVPQDWKAGWYSLRIKGSDGVISDPRSVLILALPTATLTSLVPSPIELEYGSNLNMKVDVSGMGPWTIISSQNEKMTTSFTPYSWYFMPEKSGIFKLSAVYNVCGYGNTLGEIAVKIKPTLVLNNVTNVVCEGSDYLVHYLFAGGDEGTNEYIKFQFLNGNQVVYRDSVRTKSGTFKMKVPMGLDVSNLDLVVSVAKYDLSKSLSLYYRSKPELVLTGNNVINQGEYTDLKIRNLRETDMLMGNLTLSDGSKHITYWDGSSNRKVSIMPMVTTTYTITSASNECGEGTFTGQAKIEVNPVASRATTVEMVGDAYNVICNGDTTNIYFNMKGTFTSGNVFTVHMSDENGANYKPLPTIGNKSPIQCILPQDMKLDGDYRVRVMTSDEGTASSAGRFTIRTLERARAQFKTNFVLYEEGLNPQVVVELKGSGPWWYEYGTDLNLLNRYSNVSSDTLTLLQAAPNQYYRIFSVANACGRGTVDSPSTLQVSLVTGIETENLQDMGVVAPNPTSDYVLIKHQESRLRTYTLLNLQGQVIHIQQSERQIEEIDLHDLPTGVYLLKVESDGKPVVYKVIKQ